jgi:hypothetical protein
MMRWQIFRKQSELGSGDSGLLRHAQLKTKIMHESQKRASSPFFRIHERFFFRWLKEPKSSFLPPRILPLSIFYITSLFLIFLNSFIMPTSYSKDSPLPQQSSFLCTFVCCVCVLCVCVFVCILRPHAATVPHLCRRFQSQASRVLLLNQSMPAG